MKALIRNVLASIGLAPASHVALATARAGDAAAKIARLEERIAKLRLDAESWKQRQQETAAALAETKKAAARDAARADGAKADVVRLKAELDDWKGKADTLTAQVRELRSRLEESRRVATVARDHLMATEVKLDLIEAAIQILDSRTREGSLRG